MPAKIVSNCRSCGKEYSHYPSKKGGFCSHACYWEAARSGAYARGTSIHETCHECGIEFSGRPKGRKRNGEAADKVFCGRPCYDNHRARLATGRCANCGVEFHAGNRKTKKKYCSHECRVENKRVAATYCSYCGCHFTPIKYQTARNRFVGNAHGATCSDECLRAFYRENEGRKRKISEAFTGDKHPLWQGGKSLFHDSSGRGPNWRKQRIKALDRDGRQCQDCGVSEDEWKAAHGYGLDVDHIVPYHNLSDWKKANALSNLRTLCRSCHMKEEHNGKHGHQSIMPFFTKPRSP